MRLQYILLASILLLFSCGCTKDGIAHDRDKEAWHALAKECLTEHDSSVRDQKMRRLQAGGIEALQAVSEVLLTVDLSDIPDPVSYDAVPDLCRFLAFGQLRSGTDSLIRLAKESEDDYPSVNFAAIWALGYLRDERALPYLVSHYQRHCKPWPKDDLPYIAPDSLRAIGAIGTAKAAAILSLFLVDGDERIDHNVCYALSKCTSRLALDALIQAADRPSLEFRAKLYFPISCFREERSLRCLINALEDPKHRVRSEAVLGIGHQLQRGFWRVRKTDELVSKLIGMLDDPSEYVRRDVISILGVSRLPAAVAGVARGLDDDSKLVRDLAIRIRSSYPQLPAPTSSTNSTTTPPATSPSKPTTQPAKPLPPSTNAASRIPTPTTHWADSLPIQPATCPPPSIRPSSPSGTPTTNTRE
jgi:hypothetical protein